ncbi:Mitochondrial Rho GTPase 1 [Morus notabilis]|uniref:Mitochondrial Rho GTPase 1 n=1 Tax=Morus notabilis TaxID=981085 RepID=W9RJ68_9ROSA|nr:Mitochondrial Rho GTPase 1 [Morus notabilis]
MVKILTVSKGTTTQGPSQSGALSQSSPKDSRKVAEELKRADAVVLTYACDQPQTLDRLSSFWLPKFVSLRSTGPIPLCSLLKFSQVKRIVQKYCPEAVNEHGLSLLGFFCIHSVIIQKEHFHTTWTVLRKAGYNNDLELADELLPSPLKETPDQVFGLVSVSFSRAADSTGRPVRSTGSHGNRSTGLYWPDRSACLVDRSAHHRSTGVMEPHGLSSHGARGLSSSWGHINDFRMLMNDFLIKRSCEPVRESIAVSLDRMQRVYPRRQNSKLGPSRIMVKRNAIGGLSLDEFLSYTPTTTPHAEWALMTLLDPAFSMKNLKYIAYSGDISSAIRLTRKRCLDRMKQESERNVYQCLVFGPGKAGKSALLDSFLGRPFSNTYNPTTEHLISDETSWIRATELLVEVASHGEELGDLRCLA